MATHNRKRQLQNSLKAIEWHSEGYNVEVIIIDDNSDETLSKRELSKYKIPITYKIRKDRYRQDPVIPNNMAFDLAKGDVIIMSCGEILMAENVISHVWNNINSTNYICYGVYSFNIDTFNHICSFDWNDKNTLLKITNLINQLSINDHEAGGANGWYIHTKFRNYALPFCASLTRSNMEKLSGYDELFQYGVGGADDDFLRRIFDLKLSVTIVDHPVTVHQPHTYTDYTNQQLRQLNVNLLNYYAARHNIKPEQNKIYKR
jgi:hypothetical protein